MSVSNVAQISNTDLKDVGVIGLEDAPGLSKADMQAKFEETARSVIIPKLNALIAEFNALATDVAALALGSGMVTQSQIDAWNAKADKDEASYRALTKTCVVGGALGWFRLGEIEINQAVPVYSALLAVQSAYTDAAPAKCGILSVNLQLDAEGASFNTETSELIWLTPTEYKSPSVAAAYDESAGKAIIYIRTDTVTDRVRVSVIGEGNAGEYTHLITLTDNDTAETVEPSYSVSDTVMETFRRRSFVSGDTIVLPACETQYTAPQPISALTVTYPAQGHYCALIAFDTASEGDITVTLPGASSYIGRTPSFGNSEHWEISIMDGVVIAAKTI